MKVRFDWFQWGMVAATVLAWAWPEPGATGGWLQPELLTKGGVALIFFLHGLTLAPAALRAGALNWRLHLLVQGCTFLLFPLIGLALYAGLAGTVSAELRLGIFFLCALPSTVSSSVTMTAVAGGNVGGAVFNATLSSLIGIVLTPLWVTLATSTAGGMRPLGPVILDLVRWLVLPLAAGQLLRPWLGAWAGRHKPAIGTVDRLTILVLVYTSFCDSFRDGLWAQYGAGTIAGVTLLSAALFAAVLGVTATAGKALGFPRADRIVAVFCGSKKTLASGVPMAKVIFGANPALGPILLPIMIYHPLQLLVGGVLAQRWGSQRPADEADAVR
jgi:sodium/bile acid cotransporter 7